MHGEIVHDVRGLERSRVLRRTLDRLGRVSGLGRSLLDAALEERTTSSSAGHDLGRCCVGNASVGNASVSQISISQISVGQASVSVSVSVSQAIDGRLCRRPIARFGWLTGA
jgi:hypothetical protein